MAPFEPKTDSKEFEIANLQQSTATDPVARTETADLTIRIWREDGTSGKAALTWNSESVLVYMIVDLVAASHGRTAVETRAAMCAHFDDSQQALVAAKRIQAATLEFLACRPGDYMGAAVLIHPGAETGFSQATAQSALRLAEPGQIIVAQQIARRFQDLPGVEFRAVPALTTGGTEHNGLMELLWASPERVSGLRNTTPASAPTANLDAPFGATMIVNTPQAHRAGEPGDRVQRSGMGSARTVAADALSNGEGAFAEGLADFERHRSFITPLRIGVAAIAIVLVVAAVLLFHPWSVSNPQPKPQSYEAPTGSVAAPDETPSTVPQPPPVVERPPDSPAPVVAKPPTVDKPPVRKKPEETPIRGFEGNSTYDGMTQKDISRLLQWARSDAGNGNYAKAAQEFRVILQLQPNNFNAREGLRKIQVAQGLEQQ